MIEQTDLLTEFFGWCSIFNITLLTITSLILMTMREMVINLHSRLFGIEEDKLPRVYIKYLGHYKILIIVFNVVPYFALKVIT